MNTTVYQLKNEEQEPLRVVRTYGGTPPAALIKWARAALIDLVEISLVDREHQCQGETALPGDWFVEFDGQLGVRFRPLGTRRLGVVTRNDGEPAEIIELLDPLD
jgi:hypothetical protein